MQVQVQVRLLCNRGNAYALPLYTHRLRLEIKKREECPFVIQRQQLQILLRVVFLIDADRLLLLSNRTTRYSTSTTEQKQSKETDIVTYLFSSTHRLLLLLLLFYSSSQMI